MTRVMWIVGVVVALGVGGAFAAVVWRGPAGEAVAVGGPASSVRAEADALFDAGRFEEAFPQYVLATEADPDDHEAYGRMALVAVLQLDWVVVRRLSGELARLDPDGPATAAAAAALDFHQGGDVARHGLSAARTILKDHPGELIARWVVIQSLLRGDNPCAALPEIDAAIAEVPLSYEFEELRLAAFGAAGDRAGGGEQLRRMQAKFPDNSNVSEWLLEGLQAAGDDAGAVELLREMAATAGDDAGPGPGLRLVSYLRSVQGDEAADAELARLGEATDDAALAATYRTERARSLEGQGRLPEAMRQLEAIIADPDTPIDQRTDSEVALADLLRRTGGADGARSLLDGVLRDSPSHVGALRVRASWLIEEGDAAAALDALRLAQSQRLNDPGILALMGTAYALEGSDALAGDSFARAVEESGGGERETQLYADFLRARGRTAAADALLGMERRQAAGTGNETEDESVAEAASAAPSSSCGTGIGAGRPAP